MSLNKKIVDSFVNNTTSGQVKTLEDDFVHLSKEQEYLIALEESVQDRLEQIPEKEYYASIFQKAMMSIVSGINLHLKEAFDALVAEGNILHYFDYPTMQVPPGNVPIPYVVNYVYTDLDMNGGLTGGTTYPTIREPSGSISARGITKEIFGKRLATTNSTYEFFTQGIEIYFMQPYKPNPFGTTPPPVKVVVVSTALDSELAAMIDYAHNAFDIYENIRNGVEETQGFHSEAVYLLQDIQWHDNKRDYIIARNGYIRELLGE